MPRSALLLAALVTSSLWLAVECLAFTRVALAVAVGHIQLVDDDSFDKSMMMTVDPRLTWHQPTMVGVVAAVLFALAACVFARRAQPNRLAALHVVAFVALLAGFAQSCRLCVPAVASSFALSFSVEPLLRSLSWLGAGVAVVAALAAIVIVRRCSDRTWRLTLLAWLAGAALLAVDVAIDAYALGETLRDSTLWTHADERASALATSTSEHHAHLVVLAAMVASALVAALVARRALSLPSCGLVCSLCAVVVVVVTTAAAAVLARETSTPLPRHSLLARPAVWWPARMTSMDTPWPSDVVPLADNVLHVGIDGAALLFEGIPLGWANVDGSAALEEKLIDHRQMLAVMANMRGANTAPAIIVLLASGDVAARDVAKRARDIRDVGYEVQLAFVERVEQDRPLLGRTRTVRAGVSPSLTARMLAERGIEPATYAEWAARTER
jgi:hypothetical protein